MAQSKKVRFGIVGMGTIGNNHARKITAAGSRDFALAAVCDIDPAKAEAAGETYGVPHFTDAQAMFDAGLCDAAIIGTPHYWHAPLGIRAARAKLHVLCEKPLSSSVGPARALIAECKKRRVVLGAMLQQRTRPEMATMRRLIHSGRIGEVFRVEMIVSAWFRTQAYYDSGAWRGTWDGEGGGVLINQAPHSLDLFQWVGLGLPRQVLAMVATREHKIEVEDTADILLDYGDGRHGYIYASTAHDPGQSRFSVFGDKGALVAEGDVLRHGKLKHTVREHIYGSKISDAVTSSTMTQDCTWREVPLGTKKFGGHIEVIARFAAHLRRGKELIATGAEAINELEISNAAYLSGFTGRPASVPVDAAAMERLLARLERQRSTGRGGGMRKAAQQDLRKLTCGGK